ncbi:P-loop containing nucleoside triphosphate hydrolase protein [Dichomitus squalens]|uniref:GTP-binding protein 8 n=1 Tax=Dichomitus squalens TaxID=114155 RepID=A0A4Q9NME0_9APHY|nr:P-loop containing nucleoside triphosphate hydrolase protein [Dichomitus squalens]TBU41002.1 P-loop containing nucleoside triphosphate hydrolase protein [Dichomitus squalens]TBU59512.1 P-loop containing nucleoside triphosphate hydrolase protein [Dichomitus squalens]
MSCSLLRSRTTTTSHLYTSSRRASSKAPASKVFANAKSAEFLAAAATQQSIPNLHGLPEVIVTGRANVGKSTLLNAVLGRRNLLHTSKTAGRTQTLNFYRVGPPPGHLVLVDAPGYGARGRREWGELFNYYVQNRKELRRVFILFNAKHGVNEVDRMMLSLLDEQCQASGGVNWTLQAIITKTDGLRTGELVKAIKNMQKDIYETAPTCLPPILTSAHEHPHLGIEDVRQSITEACGLSKTETKLYRPP